MIAAIPAARQPPVAVYVFLGGVALLSALGILFSSPVHAIGLMVWVGVVVAVVLDGRLAYVLLPATVPFGSLFVLPVQSVGVTPSDLIIGSLLLTFVVGWCSGQLEIPKATRWTGSLVFLVLAMGISTVTAISVAASAPELVKWSEALLVAALAPVFLRSRRDVEIVLSAVVLAATAEACVGIFQFLTHSGPKAFDIHHRFLRAYGTFGQPNPLAGYLNLVLPVAFALAIARRNILMWLATLLIGCGVLVTLSRGGWLAGGLALAVVALWFWRPLRPVAVMGLVSGLGYIALIGFGIVSTGPLARVATSFGLTGINFGHHTHANFSEVERAAHWVAGLRMFASHPFTGVGIGNYRTAYVTYHVGGFLNPLGHAHNYFINIAAETGVIGLLAFAMFLVAGILTCWKTAQSFPMRSLPAILAIGVLGMWVSSSVHNLFDVVYVHEMPALVAVLMGLVTVSAAHGGLELSQRRAGEAKMDGHD